MRDDRNRDAGQDECILFVPGQVQPGDRRTRKRAEAVTQGYANDHRGPDHEPGLILIDLDLVEVKEVEHRKQEDRNHRRGREEVQRGEQEHRGAAGDESPSECAATAMRKMRKQGADDRQVRHVLGRQGGERVTASRVGRGEVCAAVTAEVAGRHRHPAVRAGDQGRSLAGGRCCFAGATRALPAVGASFLHAPPPFMYWIHAASSATPSMLPQPVAKSQPGAAS